MLKEIKPPTQTKGIAEAMANLMEAMDTEILYRTSSIPKEIKQPIENKIEVNVTDQIVTMLIEEFNETFKEAVEVIDNLKEQVKLLRGATKFYAILFFLSLIVNVGLITLIITK